MMVEYLRKFSSHQPACNHQGRCRRPCQEYWDRCGNSRSYHRHIRPDPRKNDHRWPIGYRVARRNCTRIRRGCCGTSPGTARVRCAADIRCGRCTSYRWMLTGNRRNRNTGTILACWCTGPHSRRYPPSTRPRLLIIKWINGVALAKKYWPQFNRNDISVIR